MENLTNNFIIAALLHDIERFKKRAGDSSGLEWNGHKLSDEQEEIIKEACSLASKGEAEENNEPIPLVSIFSKLTSPEGESKEKTSPRYYSPQSITNQCPEFLEEDSNAKKGYSDLWKNFVKEFDEKVKDNLHPENLLLILEKYTSLIPFDKANQEISLFDHLKTTAAIASCLYLYHRENPAIEINDLNKEEFLLVGGDFSGVQDFVYTITSKGALKTLKARSFFLELFTEHIIYEVLHPLGLSTANIICAGGGRFNLLLPNIEEAETKLKEIRGKTNDYLITAHEAKLYLVLDWIKFAGECLVASSKKNISDLWKELGKKIGEKKRHKFKEYLEEEISVSSPSTQKICKNCRRGVSEKLFSAGENICKFCLLLMPEEPQHTSLNSTDITLEKTGCPRCNKPAQNGKRLTDNKNTEFWGCEHCLKEGKRKVGECQICHHDPTWLVELPHQENVVWVCSFCDSLYHLGEYLHFAREIYRKKEIESPKKALVKIQDTYYHLPMEGEVDNEAIEAKWGINSWDIKDYREEKTWPFLLGNYPKRLSDFKKLADASTGTKKIGVLRMDVDNLGDVFIKGFEERERTFSRLSSLSRHLTLFFKFYLNKICKGLEVYIVYSGGDDLFVVGAWSDVIELAFKIHEEFDKYTSKRLTLSGGFVVLPHNFPLYQMADLSGEAEKKAKKNKDGGKEKDSIALFYSPDLIGRQKDKKPVKYTYKWGAANEQVKRLLDGMKDLMTDRGPEEDGLSLKVSRGFIYNLLEITDIYRRKGKLYLPKLAYVLTRAEAGLRRNFIREEWEAGKKEEWEKLKAELMRFQTIESLHTTLMWLELLTRKEG